MLTPSRCITLRTVKYKDNRSIVTCLSRSLGRLSIMVNDGGGREAMRRRALMMPGSGFDCVIDIRPNRDIHTIRDIVPARLMLLDNPSKTAIILFICDFLNSIMRDSQPDENLFDFIDQSIASISDAKGSPANAAICFLIGFQRFMGIEPDVSTYREGSCLDMIEGIFRATPPLHNRYLDPERSAAAMKLSRMNRRNMGRFRLTVAQRREVLDSLLDYYSIHFGSFSHLNSLPILRSLFS